MFISRHQSLMVLAALVLAAGGVGLTWRTLSSGEQADPAAGPAYAWRPGQRLVYRLQHVSAGALEQEALPGSPLAPGAAEPAWACLGGELVASVVDVRGDEICMTYAVRQATVRAEGGADLPPAAMLRDELSREAFATLDRRGRVLSVRFEPTVGEVARQYLRVLLAATQFVVPDAADRPDAWEVREETPEGAFLVRYAADPLTLPSPPSDGGEGRVRGDAAAATFVKTRVRHLPPPRTGRPGAVLSAPTLRPEGSWRATFDPRAGHLLALSGEEGLTVLVGGRTAARRHTSVALELVRAETVSADTLAELRRAWTAREPAPAVSLSWREPPAAQQAAAYQHLLGDATPEALLAELQEAENAPERVEETALDLRLRALAALRPEACPQLGRVLAAAPAKGPTLTVLARALGGAGHPAAQQALAEAIRARGADWPALYHLIPALGMVEAPTSLAEEALRTLAASSPDWNIRSTAQLALGVMAGNLQASDPQRAAGIVDWALRELSDADTPARRRQMLLVLGNAGSGRALAAIRATLTDAAPEVRAAAAQALRWVDGRETEALLLRVLAADAEAVVRSTAATALGFRPASAAAIAAAGEALAADPSASVRQAVLRLLWEARDDFPEAGRLVEQAAANDPSAEVRDLAASLAAPARGVP